MSADPPSPDDEPAELERQIAQKRARLARLEALARHRERTADTRRKILVGATVLAFVEHDPGVRAWLDQQLDGHLVRDRDRALFGLAPLLPPAPNSGEN